mmetsp:Transcript_21127/g.49467  ORF Transcript_21127/g.49467 Transcript_21127/m.49467 type:complete len:274 (-) Transcript_21127:786-1607(-)
MASAHHFVHEEKLSCNHSTGVEHLGLDVVVVIDALRLRIHCLPGHHVQPNSQALDIGLLQLKEGVLRVKSRVHSKGLRDDEQCLSKCLHTQLGPTRHSLGKLNEMRVAGNLKGASTGEKSLVLHSILDGTESVAASVLDLLNGVLVRALEQHCARQRVLGALHEGELVIAQSLLVHNVCPAEITRLQLVEGVDSHAAAGQGQTLHIAALGTTDTNDAFLGKHVQRQRVNTLLIDHHESLAGIAAHRALELDDLAHSVIRELPLCLHQLLTLFR